MIKRKGHYSGTEIDGKWWKRYGKDKMFARGAGEYWYDGESFYFRRYLTRIPIVIRFSDIKDIKTGKWHAGQWAGGRKIVKIMWEKDGLTLSSGFILADSHVDTVNIAKELENYVTSSSERQDLGCPISPSMSLRFRLRLLDENVWTARTSTLQKYFPG